MFIMKTFRHFLSSYLLLLLFVLGLSASPSALSADELTIANRRGQSNSVPYWGFYSDEYHVQSQSIYLADSLASIARDSVISEIRLYADHDFFFSGEVEIRLGRVAFDRFTSDTVAPYMTAAGFVPDANLSLVYRGHIHIADGVALLPFDDDYVYQGGNLLVDIRMVEPGCKSRRNWLHWYGDDGVGREASLFRIFPKSANYAEISRFLPKATFVHSAPSHVEKPYRLSVVQNDTADVTVRWQPRGTETAWDLRLTDDKGRVLQSFDNLATTQLQLDSPTIAAMHFHTYYYVQVRPHTTATEFNTWSGRLRFHTGWCHPYPTNQDSYGITNVRFGSGPRQVNQSTNKSGYDPNTPNPVDLSPYYEDYSRQGVVGDVYAGEEEILYLTSNSAQRRDVVVWIDYNNDFIFEPDEVVAAGFSHSDDNSPARLRFTVPVTVQTGRTYRMRIMGARNYLDDAVASGDYSALDACHSADYCVVQDFDVHVLPITCPKPRNLRGSHITVASADIAWSPGDRETGWTLRYKAEQDDDWTQVANLTDTTHALTGLSADTRYIVEVQANCSADEASHWSEQYSFRTGVCAPRPQNPNGCPVTEFHFGTGNIPNNTVTTLDGFTPAYSNTTHPAQAPFYGDYTAQGTARVVAGVDTSVIIKYNTGRRNSYTTVFWLDIDRNNEFSADEMVIGLNHTNAGIELPQGGGTVAPSYYYFRLNIPQETPLGTYRLRFAASLDDEWENPNPQISLSYDDFENIDPCADGNYTIIEDYTVELVRYDTTANGAVYLLSGAQDAQGDNVYTARLVDVLPGRTTAKHRYVSLTDDADTRAITRTQEYDHELTIGSAVRYYNTSYNVVSVADAAFARLTGRYAVRLPQSLSRLGDDSQTALAFNSQADALLLFDGTVMPQLQASGIRGNVTFGFNQEATAQEMAANQAALRQLTSTAEALWASFPYDVVSASLSEADFRFVSRPFRALSLEVGLRQGEQLNPVDQTWHSFSNPQFSVDETFAGLTGNATTDETYRGTLTAEAVLNIQPERLARIRQDDNRAIASYPEAEIFNDVDKLIIEADRYTTPSWKIEATAGGADFVTTRVPIETHHKIDNKYYYWIAQPYNVSLADVRCVDNDGRELQLYTDPTWATPRTADQWVIFSYSEQQRVSETLVYQMITDPNAQLDAGHGYAVAVAGTDAHEAQAELVEATLILPSGYGVKTIGADSHVYTINNVTANGTDARTPWYRNWNLLANPTYGTISGAAFGRYVNVHTRPEDPVVDQYHTAIIPVSIPAFKGVSVQVAPGATSIEVRPTAQAEIQYLPATQPEYFTLRLDNGLDRTTVIDNPQASDLYVIGEDLSKVLRPGLSLYTLDSDRVSYAFNEMNIAAESSDRHIPLGISASQPGMHTLGLSPDATDFSGEVWLLDRENHTMTELTRGAVNIQVPAGAVDNRFEIVVRRKPADVETATAASGLNAYVVDGRLYLDETVENAILTITDAQGRTLYTGPVSGQQAYRFPMRGVYMISLRTDSNLRTIKLVY